MSSFTSIRRNRWVWMASLSTLVLVSACDRSSPTDPEEHGEPESVELLDRATGERLAWTEGTGASIHWDGSIPHLDVGEERAVDVRFLDAEGREIPLDGEFSVDARLTEDSPDGVLSLASHGDHVDLEAEAAGEVRVIFSLMHGGHSDFDAPPLAIEVEDH